MHIYEYRLFGSMCYTLNYILLKCLITSDLDSPSNRICFQNSSVSIVLGYRLLKVLTTVIANFKNSEKLSLVGLYPC